MRRLLAIGLMALALLAVTPAAAHEGHLHATSQPPAASDVQIVINEQLLMLADPVYIEAGRTLLPFRAIFEALGAVAQWNPADWTITATTPQGSTIHLAINASQATVNGQTTELDVPPKIFGNRTYVPLRFVAETLGAKVEWDPDWRLVRIAAEQAHPATGLTYPIFNQNYGQAMLAVYPARPSKSHWPEEFPVRTAFDRNRYQAAWGAQYSPAVLVGIVYAGQPAIDFHPNWLNLKRGFHLGLAVVERVPTYMTLSTSEKIHIPLNEDVKAVVTPGFYIALRVEPSGSSVVVKMSTTGPGLDTRDSRGAAFDLETVRVHHPKTGALVNTTFVHAGYRANVPFIPDHPYEVEITTRRMFPPVRVLLDEKGEYMLRQSSFTERDGLG